MNAVTPDSVVPLRPLEFMRGWIEAAAKAARARAFSAWPQLGILTGFWVYVVISNLLYAKGMAGSLDPKGTAHFFAPWNARVLQHVFLYPILLLCLWGALRIGWRPAWRAVPAQLLLGIVFAASAAPLLMVGEILSNSEASAKDHSQGLHQLNLFNREDLGLWSASATSFLLTYGFALALISGFTVYRRYRDSELRLEALERAWSGARLAALRMQLSPHTLFNLLHTIRGQIQWDPVTAQSMIVALGDLLRRLLTAGERDFSSLSDELQFARLYLDLQQQRFADRLTFQLPATDDLVAAQVPSLILQPLIENAVVHGLAGHDQLVEVRVETVIEHDVLQVRVLNDVAHSPQVEHQGIGLRNVRERLNVHFGSRASFSSRRALPTLWVAELRLPLRD